MGKEPEFSLASYNVPPTAELPLSLSIFSSSASTEHENKHSIAMLIGALSNSRSVLAVEQAL